jgi:hypothetical protein
MALPFFPEREDCPLPFVPKLNFRFISDCQILPAPPPIFDCPDIIIPPEPPIPTITIPPIPIPEICIPCPEIFASATIGISCGSAAVVVTVTPLHSNSSCASDPSCGFLFDFQFTLPPPECPNLTASATLIYSEGAEPNLDVTVTAVEGSGSCPKSCDFVFDFTLTLPKPSLSLPSLSVSVPAVSVFAPCPEILTSATITQIGDEATITFTATPIAEGSDSCKILLDLDITIPEFPSLSLPEIVIPSIDFPDIPEVPCPEVLTDAAIAYADIPAPTIEFTATVIDLRDPPASNSLSSGQSERSLSSGESLEQQASGSHCVIQLDLNIQIPEPVCPVMLGSATIGYGPTLDIDFTITPLPPAAPNEPCFYIFDLAIEIPREASSSARCPEITAAADTTSPYANVDVTVTKIDPCDYHLDFQFDFQFPSQGLGSCSCPAHGGFDEDTCQDFLWCSLPGGGVGWSPKGAGIGEAVLPTFPGRMLGELVTICECPSHSSDSGSGSISSLSLSTSSSSDSSSSRSSSRSSSVSSLSSSSLSSSSLSSSSLSSSSLSSSSRSSSSRSSSLSSQSSSVSSRSSRSSRSSSASRSLSSSLSSRSSSAPSSSRSSSRSSSSSLSSLSSSSAFSSSSEISDSSSSSSSSGGVPPCEAFFPGGQPSFLIGAITDDVGDIIFGDTWGFALNGDLYWLSEDVEGCCFGSLEIICQDGQFVVLGHDDCFATTAATIVEEDPFRLVFHIEVDDGFDCVGSFTLTVTIDPE